MDDVREILNARRRAVRSVCCALIALASISLVAKSAQGDEVRRGERSLDSSVSGSSAHSTSAPSVCPDEDRSRQAEDLVEVRRDVTALVLGPLFFAAAYVGTVAAVDAVDGSQGRGPWDALYVPFAGPVVFLIDHQTCFWPPCEVVADGVLILDEVLQLGGAAMFVVGLVPRTTVRARASSSSRSLSPIAAPLRGGGSVWGLSGTF